MPAVTITAGYGAGGSVVAPAVAHRLGFPLLDRAISARVAEALACSVEEAAEGGLRRSFAERFFAVLTPMAGGVIGGAGPDAVDPGLPVQDGERFRAQAESILRAALPQGAVVLGRAGAAALRDEPDVLRVRLFGPVHRRIRQAVEVEGVDADTAARRLPDVDRARAHYVRRLYDLDIDDPSLYHLQLDSTVLPLDACTELITAAFHALVGAVVESVR